MQGLIEDVLLGNHVLLETAVAEGRAIWSSSYCSSLPGIWRFYYLFPSIPWVGVLNLLCNDISGSGR